MAATGYTPISLYYSATSTNVPTAGNLVAGELAINTADGKLFYKDSAGVVQTIATKTTAALPTTTTGSGAIVLATSPSITTPALSGSTSGSVILAVPAVAGSNTATFPASTGTVMVSGNMPAFSVYLSANQTGISNSTWTKVQFNTKQFDTNSCYDNATNYRFTPTVAGYYQINGFAQIDASTVNPQQINNAIYKNGSPYRTSSIYSGGSLSGGSAVTDVIYFNGSTDYVELYVFITNATGARISASQSGVNCSWFSGSLIRGA
jgi:hypothetical protein